MLLRLLLVLFLVVPVPVLAEEVVETETFDGGDNGGEQTTDIVVPPTDNSLVKIDNTWDYYGGMDNYHMELEYQKHGGTANDYEFTLPVDHDVYEVGFTIGAMNNEGEVTYTHNDETTQTNTIDAQQGMNIATMFEDVVYSVQDTANKFIDSFVITINDWTLLDNVEIKYEDTTTTTTLNPLDIQRQANFASYGISETDDERGVREEEEEEQQQIEIAIVQEAEEMSDNMAETGYNETDQEREEREALTNVVIVVGDEEVTYTEKEQNDGTIERDQERAANEELYGVALTDEQVARGDLDNYDIEIIEEDMEEIGDEFFDDDTLYDDMENEYSDEEYQELERQMERDAKALELDETIEILEFDSKEEMDEYLDTVLQVEEYLEELEEFEVVIVADLDEIEIDMIDFYIETDLFPPTEEEIQADLEEVQDQIREEKEDELDEKILRDDKEREDELQDEEIFVEPIQEDVEEEVEIFEFFKEEEVIELTEEELEEEVAQIEEVIEEIIVIDIPEVTEEELEEYTEEEIVEYEEAKEEAIQEYVQELETEEVIEVIEEVNDIGVQNLEQVSEEVQEIVQAVVEEAIDDIEILTEEQVEVVAEVLQVQADDVEIIAEAVQEDEVVAEAVEEYVERAVENADVENYTLADVVTEVQYENFLENPIETFVDLDFEDITIGSIGDDMTQDQKEKAQEVVVPVILTRIASMAAFVFRKQI